MDLDPRVFAQFRADNRPEMASTAQAERRSGSRVRTIYRVAQLVAPNDSGLARVFNISDEGLRLQTQIPVAMGTGVAIRLSEDRTLKGRVVWTSGLDCGLLLNEPIDSEALLHDLGTSASQRALRLTVNKPAVSYSQLGSKTVTVQDVSLRGMKIRHGGGLAEGMRVKILLGSGLEGTGVVRWAQHDTAGLMLLKPFSPGELGSTNLL